MAQIQAGQTGKKKVHRGVEARIYSDQQQHPKVPSHGDQIDPQEEYKEDGLKIWMMC